MIKSVKISGYYLYTEPAEHIVKFSNLHQCTFNKLDIIKVNESRYKQSGVTPHLNLLKRYGEKIINY